MSKSSGLGWWTGEGWQPCNCLRIPKARRFQESRMPGNPLARFDEGRVGRTRKVSPSLLLYCSSVANCVFRQLAAHRANAVEPASACRSKRVAQPFDARWGVQHDADDIEARIAPRDFGAPGVVAGRLLHALALLPVHGRLGRTEFPAGARLDFDEGELAAIPGHQVDLAGAGERAVVARHHRATVGAQEAVGHVLADAPVIVGILAPPDAIGGAVEEADNWITVT